MTMLLVISVPIHLVQRQELHLQGAHVHQILPFNFNHPFVATMLFRREIIFLDYSNNLPCYAEI